jgi:hypothetical protein
MAHRLTNKLLARLLSDLGFEPGEATEKNHRVWRHPDSGCTLLLPVNKTREPPRPADLIGIRAQLDLHGHLDEEGFDAFAAEGRLPLRSAVQG